MKSFKTFTLLILFTFIITTGFSCRWNPFRQDKEFYAPVVLEYWGVWDTQEQLDSLIKTYQASHPTIRINYRNFRYDEYEQKLLEARADDRGPDIFLIPATWLKKYQHRLKSMPSRHKVPIYEMEGSIRPEPVVNLKQFAGFSTKDIKNKYVPVVYKDVILDGKIYGLPFYLDTLVTFYNLDLLTQAGIAEPIDDFFDLVEQAPKLTKATEGNYIIQSAASLGGVDNIPRFFDIFSSIMMQNGVEVQGTKFDPLKDEESAARLAQTFNFYTDFARPTKASYSWSNNLDNAFEMFASGKLAYFFGYSYHADELRDRGIQFDWEIKNFPQIRGTEMTKYYADYWINVVDKKSQNIDAAWNFIQSTAGSPEIIKTYLEDNKKPTALRALIDYQLEDYDTAIFASQVLTADNWYQGYNPLLAEKYLGETIKGLLSGEIYFGDDSNALQLFVNKINQTYFESK